MLRDWVWQLAARYPLFVAVNAAMERHGWFILLLLRLSPLIPFNALDYLSGVTSVSTKHYALALLGIVPGTIAFCAVGATASSVTAGQSKGSWGILVVGVALALAGVGVASYYSKQELDRILRDEHVLLGDEDDILPGDSGASDASPGESIE